MAGQTDPLENEIYRAMRRDREKQKAKSHPQKKKPEQKPKTNKVLTFLLVIFFVILGLVLAFFFWNNRTINNQQLDNSFAGVEQSSSVSQSASASSDATSAESSTAASSSSSSSSEAGATYTVVAGDFPNQIASKTGVPWTTIMALNNVSATGYNADGTSLYPGQVLKLK
ncbi:SAG1386/EF1546 family surface-associated protein [Lactococcus termiticola]|uniref:LysM domain protein n=1 Tax=Lactococcus termiticola TaxID=2169526 RepID=A0A2R5HKK9_9LACT|nr:SAG1386/EF1546 family surface-associated protein [Lactococcus termiticola]GBG97420.1 LysM domain protein [Lactococcus termiticola]